MIVIGPGLSRGCRRLCAAATRQLPPASVVAIGAGFLKRDYATQSSLGSKPGQSSSTSYRRQVTVVGDDGRVPWGELSAKEKAARGTQQTFNFAIVLAGAAGTVLVSYFLYTELFAADSKTRQFNHAVDRIKSDERCIDLLGDPRRIIAYGEPTTSKWARARPLASSTDFDRNGTEHLKMHFNVEGPQGTGVVTLHMTKRPSDPELEYETLALTVPGHQTLYLEQPKEKSVQKKAFKLLGFNLS